MKKVVIALLGNLFYDTRTFNLFDSLQKLGHSVSFLGFDWLTPNFKTINEGSVTVVKLKKNYFSSLFYLRFFFTLFARLFKSKADLYIASDFFSLPVVTIISRIRKKEFYYDAREIYTELPSSAGKQFRSSLFYRIEKFCITKAALVFVTGELDGEHLKKLYGISNIALLRNLPRTHTMPKPFDYSALGINTAQDKILLYQGIVVPERGIELYLQIIEKLPSRFHLVVLGDGESTGYFKHLSEQKKITDRVHFFGKVPQSQLFAFTQPAFAGLSLIEGKSTNSKLALPNKLFEYIYAGVPPVVSDLPQMKSLVEKYNVGAVVSEDYILNTIAVILEWEQNSEHYDALKQNCEKASSVLNWDSDFASAAPESLFQPNISA